MIATQVQTMVYIYFITRENLFTSKLTQAVEIFTEMMSILACLLLMQFIRDQPTQSPDMISNFFVAVICILIVGNITYAVVVVLDNKKFANHQKKLWEERERVFDKVKKNDKDRRDEVLLG